MNLRPVLAVPLLPLRLVATGLRLLSDVAARVASRLDDADTPEAPPPAPSPPPQRDIPSLPAPRRQQRRPPPDLPGLVRRPAPEVVAAVASLSTAELHQLYDLETAQRRRKTVTKAIEEALAPPAAGQAADTDARVDELVYTTQTTPRFSLDT